jgi:hypothetical protein
MQKYTPLAEIFAIGVNEVQKCMILNPCGWTWGWEWKLEKI